MQLHSNYRWVVVVLLLLRPLPMFAQDEMKNEKPNIIFVLVDDVSAAWIPPFAKQISCGDVEKEIIERYSNTFAYRGFNLEKHMDAARNSMPFLDEIAQKGVIFNMSFTSAPLCAPSRAGILTASYQQRFGGYDNVDIHKVGITEGFPLLPKLFKEKDYETAMIGKWHVGRRDERLNIKGSPIPEGKFTNTFGYQSSCAPGQNPLDHGFDYYFGYNNHTSLDYNADDLWEGRKRVQERPDGEFLTDLFNQKVKGFIEKSLKKRKPFFMYYAPKTLHGRLDPPPTEYLSEFQTGTPFTDKYAAHLLALDEGLRDIYALLGQYGEVDNTLFVFASDNGAPTPVPPYNTPFKGGKGSGWLGGSHIPMIMVYPGHIRPQTVNEITSTLDILPTALDYAGIGVPGNIDGRSLKPLLSGKTQNSPHQVVFSTGLHSARWSYSTDLDERNRKDSRNCPLYAWSIDNENVLLLITDTPAELYEAYPEGIPSQTIYSQWKVDPKQNNNLTDHFKYEVQVKKEEIYHWLNTLAEPVLNHQQDYLKLVALSGEHPMLSTAQGDEKNLAPNPPMGWNSWNYFGKQDINEGVVLGVIDAIAGSGLKDAGYSYVVVDGGWRAERLGPNGELMAHPDKFPNGIKFLADYAHAKGLKFGLHTVPGTHDCGGDPIGGLGNEEVHIQQFVDWGIDFIKLDRCRNDSGWTEQSIKDTYLMWHEMLEDCGRDILLSISAYTYRDWNPRACEMSRTTLDIGANANKGAFFDYTEKQRNFMSVMQVAEENNEYADYAGNGYWNDPDMMVIGNQGLNLEEQKSHFALWCIMSSPLFLGNDPGNMSEEELEIVTNQLAISVNQDNTEQGKRIKSEGKKEVWCKKLKGEKYAVLFLNRDTQEAKSITLSLKDIGTANKVNTRNIYTGKRSGEFTDHISMEVSPGTSIFLLVEPQ